jgi:hypothetical protein
MVSIHLQAYRFLKIKHHLLHSSHEKSIVERTIQYIKKDRTESFDEIIFHVERRRREEQVVN